MTDKQDVLDLKWIKVEEEKPPFHCFGCGAYGDISKHGELVVVEEQRATQQEVLDVVGEKWYVTYDQDGEKMMGLCNHHQALPKLISHIRSLGGKNIVIVDKTIFFVDDEEEAIASESS